MATPTSIATAIATALSTLPFVDSASATSFAPALANVTCVAFVVPFGQTSGAEFMTFGDVVLLKTEMPVEFWIQHKPTTPATTINTARDACALAIAKLIDQDGTGYTLARDVPFRERINDAFVNHAGVDWLIATLRVPVENEVAT
jgi:hypothetical protein